MRKSCFCVSLLGLISVTAPFSAGFAPLATVREDPLAGSSSLIQGLPAQQTWEDHFQEIVRRLRAKLGDPSTNTIMSLKTSTVALQAQFALFGLPNGLTAAELSDLELDAIELRDCALTDPKPPLGTDFGLVVFMHDVGVDLLKAIDQY